MNKRVLTDWRQRHYLPPLQSKGLGRGQGKTYFWAQQNILERAVLVDDLLNDGFQGTTINMVIWLFGYDVPLHIVRETLQRGIEHFEYGVTGGNPPGHETEDFISHLVYNNYRLARRLNRRFPDLHLEADEQPEEMEMYMNLLFNPAYDLYDSPFEEGALAAVEMYQMSAGKKLETDVAAQPLTEEEVRSQWDSFRQYFSMTKLKTALLWASDGELLKARADVNGLFQSLGELLNEGPGVESLKSLRLHAAYKFGSVMILVDLSLRHSGFGPLIDSGLTKLHEHLAKRSE